jgi:hypothetical protein
VARWEHITGRVAPAPALLRNENGPRPAPEFVEWLMGLPTAWPSAEPATDGAWQWGPASTSGDRTDCRVSVLAAWVAEATRPPAAITPLGERRGCPRCGDPAFVGRPGSEQ